MAAHEIHKTDIGTVVSSAFTVYAGAFLQLIIIVAIVDVTLAILGTPAQFVEGDSFVWYRVAFSGAAALTSVLTYPLLQGALTHAVSQQLVEAPVSVARAYSSAWGRYLPILGASALVFVIMLIVGGIPIGLGYLLIWALDESELFLIPWAAVVVPALIYVLVRLVFVVPAALLDRLGPVDAVRRSWNLVVGDWWRTFAVILVMIIITFAASLAIGIVLGLLPVIGSYIASLVAGILTTPLIASAITVLYVGRRTNREGYDLAALAADLDVSDQSQGSITPH